MSDWPSLREVEIGDLLAERGDVTGQLVSLTQQYINATRPLHGRLAVIEGKLDKTCDAL
ncbi:hypothetical protein [Mycobacterium sp. MUNTM1]